MADRVRAALDLLAPHLVTIQSPMYFRELLDDLYDGAQDDLLEELRDASQAAAAWGVTERRARAHIARLHAKYGIGRQIGGARVIRQAHIDRYRPDERYKRKEGTMSKRQAQRISVEEQPVQQPDPRMDRARAAYDKAIGEGASPMEAFAASQAAYYGQE